MEKSHEKRIKDIIQKGPQWEAFITFKKWSALYILVLLVLFAGFAAILWRGSAINASKNLILEQAGEAVLVIDPGHGGMDGGAVAADGTVEAGINLAVGLQMEALSELLGHLLPFKVPITAAKSKTYSSDVDLAVHPTQKPVDLLEYLIKTYSNEDDLVLDNTMGSGSTGVAALNTNRNFIGMELEQKYFDIAEKRLTTAKQQVEESAA